MSTSSVPDQVIKLPKGGGALHGIGESFKANLFNGTGNFAVPIAVSAGRSGFTPTLTLQYSTGAGNGVFGLGWELSTPRISRKTEKGLPRYDDTDTFLLSGAEDLVRINDPPLQRGEFEIARYRPRTEGLFARIERWSHAAAGESHWRVIDRKGVTSIYGSSPRSRIADPEDPAKVFEWLLDESSDAFGNRAAYDYARDKPDAAPPAIYETDRRTTQLYLRRICYGNFPDPLLDSEGNPVTYPGGAPIGCERDGRRYAFEIVFDYGGGTPSDADPRPAPPAVGQQEFFGADVPVREDVFSAFRARFDVRTLRRCSRVLVFHHFAELGQPTLVRSTDFTYRNDPDTLISLLTSVTQTGYVRRDAGYIGKSFPPITFEYSSFTPEQQRYRSLAARGGALPAAGLDDRDIALVDLLGHGFPDLLEGSAGGFRYWRNLGGGEFDRPQALRDVPAGIALSKRGVGFGDMAGDGRADLLVHTGPLPGFYESTSAGTWKKFTPYAASPSFDLSDPDVRLLDLTGDGLADVLMTTGENFLWFQCLGEKGFAAPEAVARRRDARLFPDVFFNDPAARVRLASMSGGPLNDIVLVHDDRIEYWPNLGYGRFGARITMENAPHLGADFDPKRLFLADLNGTGCSDLVYVEPDRVHFWFNQCGNRWSERRTILGTPGFTHPDALRFADVFGTGTATLVWGETFAGQADGHYKALDFCGGVKPLVLTQMSNNLGATTRVSYASSTRYAREDAERGTPWITSLPFPVHVVDKVEIVDHISRTKLVTTYQYHHGYFDGRDREFRGFARVDQFDTEDFAEFSRHGLHGEGVPFENGAAPFFVPPVETRTWFHTGIYFDEDFADHLSGALDDRELTNRLRSEFYDADPTEPPVGEHVIPDSDRREACRALRGAILRTEIYSRDGTEKAPHPYVVTEHRYEVTAIQAARAEVPGIFAVRPLEILTRNYERNRLDPRVSHSMTLEVDEFLNPLQMLSVAYGRRLADPALPTQADGARQSQTATTYTRARFTNPVDIAAADADRYHEPLAADVETFELTGFAPQDGAARFSLEEWTRDDFARLRGAQRVPYETEPPAGVESCRLIERVRTLYRRDDLAAPLPLGELESLALPFERYVLAFTPGLLAGIYEHDGQALLPDAALVLGGLGGESGGYVDLDNDGHWWIPSGRTFLSPRTDDSPAQELAFARQHFFLPHRIRNPLHSPAVGSETVTLYDPYALLVRETRDALGNRVTVGERRADGSLDSSRPGIDYRTLHAVLVMDANRNRAAVAVDALGMVVGSALMGKPEEQLGDTLEGFIADVDEATVLEHIANPLASPAAMLGNASMRVAYDLFAFARTREQAVPEAPVACLWARERHVSDLQPGETSQLQVSLGYSDGFGREIQKKVRAEAGPAVQRDANGRIVVDAVGQPVLSGDVNPRWLGSGRMLFNNKGMPVRRYEPFFSATHRFERDVASGFSPTWFYDPLDRRVATLHPDQTWQKLRFDAWRQETWDANDTVLLDPQSDPDAGGFFGRLPVEDYLPGWFAQRAGGALGPREQEAAGKAAQHAATPAITHVDPLGRPFVNIVHNRFKFSDAPAAEPPQEEFLVTRVIHDIEGNERQNIDAQQRIVMRCDYDMAGHRIRIANMDSGVRWVLPDALGNPLYAWDSSGNRFRSVYDPLRRLIGTHVRNGAEAERLVFRAIYGESTPDAEARNVRGRMTRVLDQAGVVTTAHYDFKGNLLENERAIADDYQKTYDWGVDVPEPAWESFRSRKEYDALNRPRLVIAPDGSELRPAYSVANLLESVTVNLRGAATATTFVTGIEYDASGQCTRMSFGNGATTRFEYDPRTSRLARMYTRRGAVFTADCDNPAPPPATGPAPDAFPTGDSCGLQNLRYTYDAAGNITHVRDAAQQAIYFRNRRVEPSTDYLYDAAYRLIEARGREHLDGVGGAPLPHARRDFGRAGLLQPGDGNAMGTYLERYLYDAVGNFLEFQHRGTDPTQAGWTRAYTYAEPSLLEPGSSGNRLSSTVLAGAAPLPENYAYDALGNLLQMPHLNRITWDFRGHMKMSERQAVGGAADPDAAEHGERTWYVYDGSGQRVRKVTERQNGTRRKERIYVGGFELYREFAGDGTTPALRRETLHVMAGERRVALVETVLPDASDPAAQPESRVRYQFGNHLGSASLELDEQAQLISYEEYFPYGSTSYQAGRSAAEVSLKRFRYSGMERDEESGFNYHELRYFAPWLGRWTAADPDAAQYAAWSPYNYAFADPVQFSDVTGRGPDDVKGLDSLVNRLDIFAGSLRQHSGYVEGYYADAIRDGYAAADVQRWEAGARRTGQGLAQHVDATIAELESVQNALEKNKRGAVDDALRRARAIRSELERVQQGIGRALVTPPPPVKLPKPKGSPVPRGASNDVFLDVHDKAIKRHPKDFPTATAREVARDLPPGGQKALPPGGQNALPPAGGSSGGGAGGGVKPGPTGGSGGGVKPSGGSRIAKYGAKALGGVKVAGKVFVVVGAVVAVGSAVYHLSQGDYGAAAVDLADFFTFGGTSYAKEKIEKGAVIVNEGLKAYSEVRDWVDAGGVPPPFRAPKSAMEAQEERFEKRDKFLKSMGF